MNARTVVPSTLARSLARSHVRTENVENENLRGVHVLADQHVPPPSSWTTTLTVSAAAGS